MLAQYKMRVVANIPLDCVHQRERVMYVCAFGAAQDTKQQT